MTLPEATELAIPPRHRCVRDLSTREGWRSLQRSRVHIECKGSIIELERIQRNRDQILTIPCIKHHIEQLAIGEIGYQVADCGTRDRRSSAASTTCTGPISTTATTS